MGDPAMNREQGLQSWPTHHKAHASARADLPILIQVPELPALTQRAGWISTFSRTRHVELCRPRARRRVRREVRTAGYCVMAIMTLTWLPQILLGRGPTMTPQSVSSRTGRGNNYAAFAAAPAPAISISIEPAGLAPYIDAESPVVFPGYLLPDDGCEEKAHAGS
jgi:hypothetical protein